MSVLFYPYVGPLSGPGSGDNEKVLHIPQSSNITWASPSDCFVS